MNNKISIKIPFIIEAQDYHDLFFLRDSFNGIGMKIKMKELNMEDYGDYGLCKFYFGLFYQGKCPDKNEIKKLVKKTFPNI